MKGKVRLPQSPASVEEKSDEEANTRSVSHAEGRKFRCIFVIADVGRMVRFVAVIGEFVEIQRLERYV